MSQNLPVVKRVAIQARQPKAEAMELAPEALKYLIVSCQKEPFFRHDRPVVCKAVWAGDYERITNGLRPERFTFSLYELNRPEYTDLVPRKVSRHEKEENNA